jgi:hypothetical protein
MADKHTGPRQTGIFSSLCKNFKEQARGLSPDFESTKADVLVTPWISSHPWSKNGIPDSFEDEVFSIQKELREEFKIIADSYDPDLAYSYDASSRDIDKLLQAQYQADINHVIISGTAEEKAGLVRAGIAFANEHYNNKESPYYGTYAPVKAAMTALMIKKISEPINKP